jgi:hypothetical protein
LHDDLIGTPDVDGRRTLTKQKGQPMAPGDRAVFIAAYSKLVAEVWSDPTAEAALLSDPRALLSEHGLDLPASVEVVVVRDVADAEPNLDAQVKAWLDAPELGTFTLFVPALDPVDEAELNENELDRIVGGLDTTCACCCPCCSTT